MTERTGHECPATDCTTRVPRSQYACRPHWFSIPKPLRDELWDAYRDHGALSGPHMAAMEAIDEAMGW